MTESLFFSQIANKSLAAQKNIGGNSSKMYQGDSSDFNKHLALNDDRSDNRGRDRDRDNVTELRKEPTFTKKTRERDYGTSERKEPKVRDDNPRQERTESKDKQADVQPHKKEEAADSKASDNNVKETEGQTSQKKNVDAKDQSTPKVLNNQSLADIAETITTDEPLTDLTTESTEDISLETLVDLTEETGTPATAQESNENGTEKSTTETADIIPLFSEVTGQEAEDTQSGTPQVQSTAQTTGTQTDNTAAKEEPIFSSIKQPKQAIDPKLEGHTNPKKPQQGHKTGFETTLNTLQDTKPSENIKFDAAEVKNATKDASFLGDINIEAAQKSDKTDIKARISELAQKAVSGPVATSAQAKPALNTLQTGASKIDAIGQAQPVTGETVLANTQNSHSVQVRFGSLPQATQTAQIPVTTMAFHIAKSVENGVNRFEIRIDPPELGRVEVKLEVNQAGRVVANLTVDRPETLDLLQRDQRALERALQDAGLDVGGDSLNFSLKDQNANASDENGTDPNQLSDFSDTEDDLVEPEMITGYVSDTGVDIRI